MEDFIAAWHARVHGALHDGIVWLASHDEMPEPDGVIGDFVDVLCAMRFEAADLAAVVFLLEKRDPHFQEAGVRLATSALRDVGEAWGVLEAPLAKMIEREAGVDAWVVEAIVDLLRRSLPSFRPPPVLVYRALAKRHREPRGRNDGNGIMRARGIRPWDDLEQLYEQHVIQALEPGERETVILPILEKRLGTKGFRATQDRILVAMGFDPEDHRQRLRGIF